MGYLDMQKKILVVLVCGALAVGYGSLKSFWSSDLPSGFVASNGRIEAVEIDIATKTSGRLVSVLPREGDVVTAGQVLAEIDSTVLRAQLRESEAELRRARSAVVSAGNIVKQREAERSAAEAVVLQRQAELGLAEKKLVRAEPLAKSSALSQQELDSRRAELYRLQATVKAAEADVAGAEAAIEAAKSQIIEAEESVAAVEATIQRLQAEIDDCSLKSPRDGRVQFRIAQPGEVLSAGGKVLNLVDLGEVYMTFFLPTVPAGRVRIGSEVRLVLDAAPMYVFPATVSYVADVAQFTPKTVETAEERQKLMFRVKAQFDKELLRRYVRTSKTGLPGMAYVRLNEQSAWPANLQVRLPDVQ